MVRNLQVTAGQHDIWLVVLAAAICFFASYTAFRLHRRSPLSPKPALWRAGAATAAGIGVWTTHFVSMLAYRPGTPVNLAPTGTLVALIVVVCSAWLAWLIRSPGASSQRSFGAGLVFGIGVVAMHYLGLAANFGQGVVAWNQLYLLVSIAAGVSLVALALRLGMESPNPASHFAAVGFLTTAVLILHFTGLAAFKVPSDAPLLVSGGATERSQLALAIASGTLGLLILGLASAAGEERRFEQASREIERLKTIVDAMVEGIAVCEGEVIRDVNCSLGALHGDHARLIGAPLRMLLPGWTTGDVLPTGDSRETVLRTARGEDIPVEVVTKSIRYAQGTRTFVSLRDLRAHRELRRLASVEEMSVQIAATTSDAIVCCDGFGRITFWNKAAETLFGYSREEALGHPVYALVQEDLDGALERGIDAASIGDAPRRPVPPQELVARHRDGRTFPVELTISVWNDGDDITASVIIRDISVRRQAEEQIQAQTEALIDAKARAEAAARAKSEFLANMSHELRTPLNGMLGHAELLLDDASLTPDQRRSAERIQTAGTALLTVVDDVLDFSRIEAGRIALEMHSFSPRRVAEDAVAIIRGLAENKGLQVALDLPRDLPSALLGDENRLRQILLNLLNNGVKFTAVGEVRVTVVARPAAEAGRYILRFSVVDTGIGISADHGNTLFERFSQVDGSIRREFGGAGLGLAISKRLAELMGGVIGFESEVGRGSTFWIEVVLAKAEETDADLLTIDWKEERSTGCRVLLVEDNEINREIACAVLEKAGHAVSVAQDGAAAVALVQQETFDLVLMDIQMPVMDGVSATRTIRALPYPRCSIPIVAMTANVLPQQVQAFREAGMDAHIGKPFNRRELLAMIEQWTALQTTAHADSSFLVDEQVLVELRRAVGAESVACLLEMFRNQLESAMDEDLLKDDVEELARAAHALVSVSGMLGFGELSRRCRKLEETCQAREDWRACLAETRAACRTTLAAVATFRAA
jgi:PAS domain S-box-containing protein